MRFRYLHSADAGQADKHQIEKSSEKSTTKSSEKSTAKSSEKSSVNFNEKSSEKSEKGEGEIPIEKSTEFF